MIDKDIFKPINTATRSYKNLEDVIKGTGLVNGIDIVNVLFTKDMVATDSLAIVINGTTITQAFDTSFSNTITLLIAQLEALDFVDDAQFISGAKTFCGKDYTSRVMITGFDSVEMTVESVTITATGDIEVDYQVVSRINPYPAIVTLDLSNVEALRSVVSGDTTTIGYALPGTLNAESKWKIKQVVVSGGVTTITYAEGNGNFDKIWDDRATYTYS